MEKPLIVVCSCHLDREWYLSFDETRVHMVFIVDRVLELLKRLDDYCFLLDGQTSVVGDYLEIKPERREEVTRYIAQGRLIVGPWFIQPDEVIPFGESMVRNLLLGRAEALAYGGGESGASPMQIGYVPDSFGHIAQLAQILNQFGIVRAFMMRGCPQGVEREFILESPDGSRVTAIHTSYGNASVMDPRNMRQGIHMAATPEEYQQRLRQAESEVRSRADYVLLTMGGDMMAPSPDPKGLGVERFGRLEECFERAERLENLQVIRGELRHSADIAMLQGTLTSRVYLKTENQKIQRLLNALAEPLCALAYGMSEAYPAGLLRRAWRYLLENHTHDGICGCSCDAVCREMMTRFQKCGGIAGRLALFAAQHLADQADTTFLEADDLALMIFNPSGCPASGAVEFCCRYEAEQAPQTLGAFDAQGNALPVQIVRRRETDTIRSDYQVTQRFSHDVMLRGVCLLKDLPAMGVQTVALRPVPEPQAYDTGLSMIHRGMGAENALVRLRIASNGTLEITDKRTGQVYAGLNWLFEQGNGGDAYHCMPIAAGPNFDSRGLDWKIELLEQGPVRASFRLSARWMLPEAMADKGQARSNRLIENQITAQISLDADSPCVRVVLTVDNHAHDHRIQAVFPTGISARSTLADGPFSLDRRSGERLYGPQPSQSFVAVEGETGGLAVFHKGLHQFEYTRDGELRLSLLQGQGVLYRSFFDGYNDEFSECQMEGRYALEYALYPFAPGEKLELAAQRYANGTYCVQTGRHPGQGPACASALCVESGNLMLGAVKRSKDGEMLVIRLYNPSDKPVRATLRLNTHAQKIQLLRLDEQAVDSLPVQDGRVHLEVGGSAIISLGVPGGLYLQGKS